MPEHKFRIGQMVRLQRDPAMSATGSFKVVRQLPATADGALHYRLKGVHEAHERVAAERQLASAQGGPSATRHR